MKNTDDRIETGSCNNFSYSSKTYFRMIRGTLKITGLDLIKDKGILFTCLQVFGYVVERMKAILSFIQTGTVHMVAILMEYVAMNLNRVS
jgi:hypothetical protein